jgi:putative aldouronate transport system permease protein
MVITRTRGDKIFDFINYTLITLIVLIVVYPLYFVLIASFSDPDLVNSGNLWLWPSGITFEGYTRIIAESAIWTGFGNSLMYTAIGTSINVVMVLTAGYALSRSDLAGRNFFMMMIVFTMFFGGGMIPNYLLVKNLGMLNTIWALVIPNAVSAYNIIITRTFFQTTIPHELLEASKVDGCSNTRFFLRIVLPLSMPIVAVMILFSAVGHWNSYFNALIYLRDESLFPLQIILRSILVSNEVSESMNLDMADVVAQQQIAELMKYGVIIISSLPVLILYPFLQKYFVKGVMIGSVKG